MKTLYTSPVIAVEELTKVDILCASSESFGTSELFDSSKRDNLNQDGATIGDLSRFL